MPNESEPDEFKERFFLEIDGVAFFEMNLSLEYQKAVGEFKEEFYALSIQLGEPIYKQWRLFQETQWQIIRSKIKQALLIYLDEYKKKNPRGPY